MKEQITGSDWRGRMGGKLVRTLGLVLALGLLASAFLPAYAAGQEYPPPLPHYFDGSVSDSNGPVLEGTVVEAFVDGIKKTETAVNGEGRYVVLVPAERGDDGKIVSFTVGGVQASQTTAWAEGEFNYDFDLTIASSNGFPFPLPFDCLVATAAYGTDTAKEINLLRGFRDVVLLATGPGSQFVSLYYQVSPAIAEVIWQHGFLRAAVRVGFIDPIVAILDWSHSLWMETHTNEHTR
jgi:hypothetical protein